MDEIERLMREATPGWKVGHTGPFRTDAKGHPFHIFDGGDTLVLPTPGQPGPIAIVAGPANAALIVAAVNALPGLLAVREEVGRLRAELEAARVHAWLQEDGQ